MKRVFLTSLAALCLTAAASLTAQAQCSFSTNAKSKTMTLNADCTVTQSVVVPNGYTLDGAGHTITAVDPSTAPFHFVGGVVQNGGAVASVTNLKVTASGLADACDAGADRLRGILFDGASGSITNNTVTHINQNQGAALSGCQEGNAIEVRNFGSSPTTVRVLIDSNQISDYQKTGIVVNGDADGTVTDNKVIGYGPQHFIAQNGIQIGFGATAMVKRNEVAGNSYTGTSDVSGGVLVVGGPGYGGDFCINVQIQQNTISESDVGVYVSQYEADFSAPATATNIKVVNNTISKAGVTNGFVYQAGVSDVGNNDKIIANNISGAGYDPNTIPGSTFSVDADASFTNRAKVHANK
jgi:hypothetical protein